MNAILWLQLIQLMVIFRNKLYITQPPKNIRVYLENYSIRSHCIFCLFQRLMFRRSGPPEIATQKRPIASWVFMILLVAYWWNCDHRRKQLRGGSNCTKICLLWEKHKVSWQNYHGLTNGERQLRWASKWGWVILATLSQLVFLRSNSMVMLNPR